MHCSRNVAVRNQRDDKQAEWTGMIISLYCCSCCTAATLATSSGGDGFGNTSWTSPPALPQQEVRPETVSARRYAATLSTPPARHLFSCTNIDVTRMFMLQSSRLFMLQCATKEMMKR